MDPALVFAGFAVGEVIGLCGVGGGALMTPFLIHYGISPAIAIGTDLVYALFSKSIGAWLHHIKGTVNWGIVGRLALGSIPASLACMVMLKALDEHNIDYQWLIRDIVGVMLILTASAMLLSLQGNNKERGKNTPGTIPGTPDTWPTSMCKGFEGKQRIFLHILVRFWEIYQVFQLVRFVQEARVRQPAGTSV